MPQLDPSSFASQLFWLLITFTTLYIILSAVALPTIRDVLQSRQDKIESDLGKAESARQEAETAKQDYTAALEKARQTAMTRLAETTQALKQESAARHAKLDGTIAERLSSAEAKITAFEEQSRALLHPVTVQLVKDIVGKLIHKSIDNAEVEKALTLSTTANSVRE